MKGKHHIILQNNKLHYEFDIKRNITIIRGDSATGKTTLINLIQSAVELSEESGISLQCDKKIRVLNGTDWDMILPQIHDTIIFIDEENKFIKSNDFAEAVRESDNYFVLITREDLPALPYSVDEIYGIHTSGKYHDLKRTYNELYLIYSAVDFPTTEMPENIVTEDSNSGYEFFSSACSEKNINCISAEGKTKLRDVAKALNTPTMIIADGAAIGPEMNELYQLMTSKKYIKCYLPESFEWLILKAGIIHTSQIDSILKNPEDYIDSKEFFSWEQFFTDFLIKSSKDTYLQYQKKSLNRNYLNDKIKYAILKVIKWWKN